MVHYCHSSRNGHVFPLGATYNMSTSVIGKSGDAVPVGSEGTETDLTDNALEASVSFNNILPFH